MAAKAKHDTQAKSSHAARSRPAQSRATDLDRLIHEPIRLGIISALAANETMSFNELKDLLKTTDGNLSVHARRLEEGQYITCSKFFEGRLPKTEYRLSSVGRKALETYLDHMEALIHATRDT
jgi:DNA-binding HxlR family transcriptional regulator